MPARWWPRWSAACLTTVGGAIVIGLPFAARHYLPGEEWLGLLGVIPFLGGLAMLWFVWHEDWKRGFAVLGVTAWLLVTGGFAVLAPAVSAHQRIGELLDAFRQQTSAGPLATFGVHEPSWVFYAAQTMPHLTNEHAAEAVELLRAPHARLITSRRCLAQLQPLLQDPTEILAEVPYFLRNDQLLLIQLRRDASSRDTLGSRDQENASSAMPTGGESGEPDRPLARTAERAGER